MGGGNGGNGGDGLGTGADAAVGPAVGSTGIGVGGSGVGGAPTSGAPGMGGPGGASPMGGGPGGGVATGTDIYGNPVNIDIETGETVPMSEALAGMPSSRLTDEEALELMRGQENFNTIATMMGFINPILGALVRGAPIAKEALDAIVSFFGGEPFTEADMAAMAPEPNEIGGPDNILSEELLRPPYVAGEAPTTGPSTYGGEPTTPPADVLSPDLEYPAPLAAEDYAAINRAQASIREGYEDELDDWYEDRLDRMAKRDYYSTYRPAPERSKPIRRTAAQRKTGIPPSYGIPYHKTAY